MAMPLLMTQCTAFMRSGGGQEPSVSEFEPDVAVTVVVLPRVALCAR